MFKQVKKLVSGLRKLLNGTTFVKMSLVLVFVLLPAIGVFSVARETFFRYVTQAAQKSLSLRAEQVGSVVCDGGVLSITSISSTTQLQVSCNGVQASPTIIPSATPVESPSPSLFPSPSQLPSPSPSPTQSPQPSSSPNISPSPLASIPPVGQLPEEHAMVSPPPGDFPCGTYLEPKPGCTPVSYQAWFDDVPVNETNSVAEYTPLLNHIHWEMSVPLHRRNGTNPRQSMEIPTRFMRYNNTQQYSSSNSGWWRSQDQGSTYEQFNFSLPACQTEKYQSKQCMSWHIHTISADHFSNATEMRFSPNVKFNGDERHFLSSNWQTGIGYRSTSEITARYWHERCGGYQRVIIKESDKHFEGSESIPSISGTMTQAFKTNGGCGDLHKTFVFINPSQHTGPYASNKGITAMEVPSHFDGEFVWDTTELDDDGEPKYPNGLYNVLYINFEGTDDYVSAAGVNLLYLVQN